MQSTESELTYTLLELLEPRVVYDLKNILNCFGIKLNLRKADLIKKILSIFLEKPPNQLFKLLLPLEKILLAELAHNNHYIRPADFEAKYNQNFPTLDLALYQRDRDRMNLLRFCYKKHGFYYFFATDFLQSIQPFLPKPSLEFSDESIATLPKTYTVNDRDIRPMLTYDGQRVAMAELVAILVCIHNKKLTVRAKNNRPTLATIRILSTQLLAPDFSVISDGDPEPVRAHAWAVLVQQCGWCTVKNAKLCLTSAGKDLMISQSYHLYKDGFNRFIWNEKFDELDRIKGFRLSRQDSRCKYYISSRRINIIKAMRAWPTQWQTRWVPFDRVFQSIFQLTEGYDVADHLDCVHFSSYDYEFLESSDTGLINGIRKHYLRAILMENLATLGIIDIAYVPSDRLFPEFNRCYSLSDDSTYCSIYDGLCYSRLTELGLYILGINHSYDSSNVETVKVTVLANRDIIIQSDYIPPLDYQMLCQIAKKTGDMVWSLDQALLLEFIERQSNSQDAIDSVITFITERSDVTIPEPVIDFVNSVNGKCLPAKSVSDVILINLEKKDHAVLIAHDNKAKKQCYLIGDTHIAIPVNKLSAFRKAIKKMGVIIPKLGDR